MPNIVYVLTNPAMPGIVKIGMTDGKDVQRRMGELYSIGVPLPFESVIAREIEGIGASEIESALHIAFGPHRLNPSREFFQLESEQVEVLLRVMPGKDVTPPATGQSGDLSPDDVEASSAFQKKQSQTNEEEFLDALNENGRTVYERVLALGKQSGMRVKWGLKGFSLNAVSKGALIVVCYGYPLLSVYKQNIYTGLDTVSRKSNIPDEAVETLRKDALDSGLFASVGQGDNLMCPTDRAWDEAELDKLMGWMNTVVEHIRMYET